MGEGMAFRPGTGATFTKATPNPHPHPHPNPDPNPNPTQDVRCIDSTFRLTNPDVCPALDAVSTAPIAKVSTLTPISNANC